MSLIQRAIKVHPDVLVFDIPPGWFWGYYQGFKNNRYHFVQLQHGCLLNVKNPPLAQRVMIEKTHMTQKNAFTLLIFLISKIFHFPFPFPKFSFPQASHQGYKVLFTFWSILGPSLQSLQQQHNSPGGEMANFPIA